MTQNAGFDSCRVYPHPTDLNVVFYQTTHGVVLAPPKPAATGLRGRLQRLRQRVHHFLAPPQSEPILWIGRSAEFLRASGIVRLIKPSRMALAA
jgi:hypothetical protein